MKLTRIEIRRAPGITEPFTLCPDDGVNIVVGPNGVGKTTFARHVRRLLWPQTDREPSPMTDVEALFDDEGDTLSARREGRRVRWQRDGREGAAPAVPDEHLARCFSLGIRDLLAGDEQTDKQLSADLLREMAGGYDVEEARSHFRPSLPRKAKTDARDAAAEVARIEEGFRRLAEEEAELAGLEAGIDRARAEKTRLDLLRRALDRAELEAHLREQKRARTAFPPEMSRLRGDEEIRLATLEQACRQEDDEILRLDGEIAAEQTRRDGTGLDRDVARETLVAWEMRADRLAELEAEQRRARLALAQAEGQAESAREQLAGSSTGHARAPRDARHLRSFEEIVHEAARARFDVEGRERVIRILRPEIRPPDETVDPVVGIDLLREWLSAGDGVPGAATLVLALLALTASALAALAPWLQPILTSWVGPTPPAWLVPWLEAPAPAGWIAAAPAVAMLAVLALRGLAWRRTRRRLRRTVEELGGVAPAAWTADAVRTRLHELERLADEARLRDRLRERAAEMEGELESPLARREAAEKALAQAAEKLGIEAGSLLSFEVTARRLFEAEQEQRQTDGARAKLATLDDEIRAALADAEAAAGQTLVDAAAWKAYVRNQREKSETWRLADRQIDQKRHERARAVDRRADAQQVLAQFFDEIGLRSGDHQTLRDRLAVLPRWTEIRDAIRVAEARRAELDDSLAEADLPEDRTATGLRAEIEDAESRAASIEEKLERRAQIEERLREARQGQRLTDAIRERDSRREELHDRREQYVTAIAARRLLSEVTGDHEERSRPSVLEEAIRLFGLFTHNEFRLLPPDPRDSDPSFRAYANRERVGLRLTELSDGTSIQLRLAVRLSFALHAERGVVLPLFLDETLSTADPERFAGIIRCLARLAETGRQIFYLTSNPADAALWCAQAQREGRRPPKLIDLGKIRRGQAALGDLDRLAPPAKSTLVSPAGLRPETWAQRIGVPAVDLAGPVEALHLYHVLFEPDDLELLHRILESLRLDAAGPWDDFSRRTREPGHIDLASRARVDARIRCAREVFAAYAVGRGRPVDRAALETAGPDNGVSEAYLDKLAGLAADCGGEAQTLVDALHSRTDGRTKGYRDAQRLKFEAWLEKEEYLDPSPVLSPDEIRARVLAQTGAIEHLDADLVHRIVDHLLRFGRFAATAATGALRP